MPWGGRLPWVFPLISGFAFAVALVCGVCVSMDFVDGFHDFCFFSGDVAMVLRGLF